METVQWCGPHLARTGKRIAATQIVNGEYMCQECFKGKPINTDTEEHGIFLGRFRKRGNYLKGVLIGNAQALAHEKTQGRVAVASRKLRASTAPVAR